MSKTEITMEDLPLLFESVADVFAKEKDHLCEMDAQLGDGDLGLTMSKGYGALPDLIRSNAVPDDMGKTLMKAGMKMAGLVPSTMGTLMASGIMAGGKAIAGKSVMGSHEMADFIKNFAAGLAKRGKCQAGDRTIYDALLPAGEAAEEAAENGAQIAQVVNAALEGAKKGVENTRNMVPKYGKAAVFSAKAVGKEDQGAVAGKDLIQGLALYFQD
ncbi:MAG: dihydroxyacetone kinase subunit L [Blautia sp.]|nr:dihydroxyacetone kinase subunit L [Blautia sp.]